MNNENLTKFEKILKEMSVDEKAQVMDNFSALEKIFRSKIEDNGETWLDAIGECEVLRNIFICSCIASNEWLMEHIEK